MKYKNYIPFILILFYTSCFTQTIIEDFNPKYICEYSDKRIYILPQTIEINSNKKKLSNLDTCLIRVLYNVAYNGDLKNYKIPRIKGKLKSGEEEYYQIPIKQKVLNSSIPQKYKYLLSKVDKKIGMPIILLNNSYGGQTYSYNEDRFYLGVIKIVLK